MKTTYVTLKPDMARAYREKRKLMTRRVMRVQPPGEGYELAFRFSCTGNNSHIGKYSWIKSDVILDRDTRYFKCPYGHRGDQLILGTTWAVPKEYDNLKPAELPVGHLAGLTVMTTSGTGAAFKPIPIWSYFDGDEKPEGFGRLRRARFFPNKLRDRMPRETLKIVRAERVQDITEDDAWNEGIDMGEVMEIPCSGPLGVAVFSRLWNSINSDREYSWDSNPWVWCLGW
jgi:hypothetical protein